MSATDYNASASKAAMMRLHRAQSVREMNALVSAEDCKDYVKYSSDYATVSNELWNAFDEARVAQVCGDEEVAYLKFTRVINLYISLREKAVDLNAVFHETQLQECVTNNGRLTESLISRYLALDQENVGPAEKATITKSSGGFFGKLVNLFSGSGSKEKSKSTASILGNSYTEIERMRERQRSILRRLHTLRAEEERRKMEQESQRRALWENEQLQRLRTLRLASMRKKEEEAATERSRVLKLEEQKRTDEQRQALIREQQPRQIDALESSKLKSDNQNAQKVGSVTDKSNESGTKKDLFRSLETHDHNSVRQFAPIRVFAFAPLQSSESRQESASRTQSSSATVTGAGSSIVFDRAKNLTASVDCKLQFSGFPTNVDEKEILQLFAACGPVKDFYALKSETGELRGSGTVEFQKSADATRAIAQISGFNFGSSQNAVVSKCGTSATLPDKSETGSSTQQNAHSQDKANNQDSKLTINIIPKSANERRNSGRGRGRTFVRTGRGASNHSRSRDGSPTPNKPDIQTEDNSVYFRGFPTNTVKDTVLSIFGKYGSVVRYELWKKNGEATGCGVIVYEDIDSMNNAIREVTGMNVCGKKVYVHKFVKRENRKTEGTMLHLKFKISDVENENSLRHLFQKFGEIRFVNLDKDKNGESTGFGKVCFRDADSANRAALEMDNYLFPSGRTLHVSKYDLKLQVAAAAIPETSKQMDNKFCDQPNVYVSNITGVFNTEEELCTAFSRFGPIRSAKVMMQNNLPRGFGFVCFYSHYCANKAINEMNNVVIKGKQLVVRKAFSKLDDRRKLKSQFLVQRGGMGNKKRNVAISSILNMDCSVCLTESTASESVLLSCNHVVCKECIVHYIQHLVNNKEVESIICPKDDCDLELTFNLIKSLIPRNLLKDYDTCLMNSYLNKRDDIIWCPKADCRCPVFITPGMTSGVCPKCKWAFCPKCGERYHGFRECNDFRNEDDKRRALQQYTSGSAEERAALEKRYTKKRLEKALEEKLSDETIKSKCKQCPQCRVNIEKHDGCNKMSCSKCKAFFCWLCMKTLDKNDPYKHFSDSSSACYRRLFPITSLH